MLTRITTAAALVATAVALAAPAAHAAGPPEVTDTWASAVNATAADLHGAVNPNGLPTSVRVEYLTDAAYQANLGAQPPRDGFSGANKSPNGSGVALGAGTEAVEFFRHVSGLKASTAYRYRVAATNSTTTFGPARVFITQESTPTFVLPDGRGWEMVSPVDKNGGEIQAAGGNFGGGVLQAAFDGTAVTYSSRSSFAGGQGAPGVSQYTSRRGSDGWGTENITLPTLAGAFGPEPDGVPYQLFSTDLAQGLMLSPQRCEVGPCPRRYDLRRADGAVVSSPMEDDLTFAGASGDLSQVVLSTCAALTPNAVEAPGSGGACDPAKPNLYRWAGGALTLVNVLPGDTQGTPGATLAAQSGAISGSGSRVYFTQAGNLYLRDGSQTVQVDDAVGGGGTFQTASADGSVAFFTATEVDGQHLHRFAATTKVATDLTPAGDVQGVLGASPDGGYLYYLTTTGLYLSRSGTTTKVAASADASTYPPATGAARVAANGNLAFLSSVALTGADTPGIAGVYLYSASTATLVCASCNPTGARPLGPSTIPGAIGNGTLPTATRAYKPRALSATGNRIFFDSYDSLAVQDTNNDRDVYQWEGQGVGSCQAAGGCISLISSGRSTDGASFVDASADGADVFFLTDGSLVPTDPGVVDLYDARVGGGFPAPTVPIACVADACQVVPGEPEDPSPGTAFYRPEGNPPVSYPKAKKQKKQKKRQQKKKGKTQSKKAKAKKGGRR